LIEGTRIYLILKKKNQYCKESSKILLDCFESNVPKYFRNIGGNSPGHQAVIPHQEILNQLNGGHSFSLQGTIKASSEKYRLVKIMLQIYCVYSY
jgi:hypothetical protein